MKKLSVIISFACLAFFACNTESEEKPEAAFIKAKVNGEEVVYSVSPKEQLNYIATEQNFLAITLYKNVTTYEHWAITVSNVDIDNIKLPYTIQGPNPDSSGKSPEFTTVIYDPQDGDYGNLIAGANTFGSDLSITITFFDGEVIKGTFEGAGFTDGEFQAKLPRVKI